MGAEVGKFALESLTTGMYENQLVIFREYIQNSADSIDKAVKMDILSYDNAYIDVVVNKDKGLIEIYDNGAGIETALAYDRLTNIGKSDKDFIVERGFRGIGRLAGFAYCSELIFETSYFGENKKSVVCFDCNRLKELLRPGEYNDMDVTDVIKAVTNIKYEEENPQDHYFIVRMNGVDSDELLDNTKVKDYLAQVAPVKYERQRFVFANEILKIFRGVGLDVTEFKVNIGLDRSNLIPIYKPYRGRIQLSSRGNQKNGRIDDIKGIVPIIQMENNEILYVGWYAKTNLMGACSDDLVKGLRLRQGNILVGDSNTLSNLFREDRFNAWYIGEIHIFDKRVIPNARRDNFEMNSAYNRILKYLEELCDKLSVEARDTSKQRNNKVVKITKKIDEVHNLVDEMVRKGSSKAKKEKISEVVEQTKKEIQNIKTKKVDEQEILSVYQAKVEELEKKLDAEVKHKDWGIPTSYSRKERKIIQTVYETIEEILSEEDAKKLIDILKGRLL